jgi:outer membrane protein assembly factor BamB
MKILKNKRAAIATIFILTVSLAASMTLLPTTSAHTPEWNIVTHAYVTAFPSPIGVGQTAYVDMWLDKVISGADLANDIRFHNYQLTITAPDGTTESVTFDVISDPTSNQIYGFTPGQTGEYTLDFTFPGQKYTFTTPISSFFGAPAPSAYINDTYLPSSASATLMVQEDPIEAYPTTPLPDEYWSRPIYGQNSNWWTISSNWLGTGAPGYSTGMAGASFPGDAVGSQTSHVMWTKPLQFGGIVGGDNFVIKGDSYFDGSAYNNRYNNPIIISGYIYYREPMSFQGGNNGDTVCVNLQTGAEIWRSSTMPSLSFGYIYDVQDPNQHGVYPPILIASIGGSFLGPAVPATWMAYDAYTGTFMFNVTNIPTGTKVMGVNGEYLIVSLVNYGTTTEPNYYLQQWNSSRLWTGQYGGSSTSPQIVPPITDATDPLMYDFNVSVSALNTMNGSPTIKSAFLDNMIVVEHGTMPSSGNNAFSTPSSAPYTYSAYSLKSGNRGAQLWKNTVNAPAGNLTVSYIGADETAEDNHGVFGEYYTETMQFVGYSMATGQKIWGPTDSQTALAFFNQGYTGQGPTIAYGRIYTGGYSGVIYCYDMTNGDLMWTYGNGGAGNSTSGGLETARPYPTIIYAIGNDVVYTFTSEHTVTTPIYKGALTRAINATDGTEIWTLSNTNNGGSTYGAMADGYNTFFNGYDEQIYTVGRGPSKTTVSAPHSGLSYGQSVVISGTVTDISAGTIQTEQAAKLPNGVACASDASIAEWMAYVYMQQSMPTSFTGVEVTIDVLDANNNYRTIGTATTDATGTFRLTWTPDISGDYTVVATFSGTNGYYPSYAEDGFTVMNAPEATTAPTTSPSIADMYFIPAIAGLFVLIIIILVLLLLMMKKRP